MTEQTSKYQNISCSYYDQLEAYATKRLNCSIRYRIDGEEKNTQSIIVDIYANNDAEYLKLDNGIIIRLDQLVSINDVPVNTVC